MDKKKDELIQDHFPRKIVSYHLKENILTITFEDNYSKQFIGTFTFYQKGVMKVQLYQENFQPLKFDFINRDMLRPDECRLEENDNKIVILFQEYTAVFDVEPFGFKVVQPDGTISYEENMNDVNAVGDGLDQVPPIGYSSDTNHNTKLVNIGAKLHADEHIYGLGEHFTEFDKRGQTISMRNFDTLGCRDSNAYKNIPFYVSSYKYGLFVNNYKIFDFCIGSETIASISIQVPDTQLEYFLIFDNTMKNIVSTFMQLTGPAVLPPDWSFGLWYSNGFKNSTRKHVHEDANRFRDDNIPCDVMHFDCYWLREDMWCDFVWNEASYPNHIEMLSELKKQGFKICLWINPYLTIVSDMFKEAKNLGYLLINNEGEVYTADLWHGLLPHCGIVDFTNDQAAQWFEGKVLSVLSEGVDVLKTDFAEDIPYDSLFYNQMTGKEMRNIYSRLYNRVVFEATKKMKGKCNALVWARSGCAGMQQFPVCWSGDPKSSFEGMAGTLKGGLSLSMTGVPFWSHDMGGFYGDVTEEIFIRWSQFGLFSSHSRLHGTSTRQPWAYGEKAFHIVTKFIKLRYQLMPYILRTAKECVENSVPFIRPLVLEHDNDPAVYHIYDEYYFGNDIIVAPVFGGNDVKRNVYLPKGNWVDMLTHELYKGEHWYQIKCPLEYMPIFVKNNIELPLDLSDLQFIE